MSEQAAGTLVGTVLDGSYRVEKLRGEGGMGAVFHATQLRLDKPVAVKVMARELGAAAEALARFRREALVTSNLGHPNIVQVFDFSTTADIIPGPNRLLRDRHPWSPSRPWPRHAGRPNPFSPSFRSRRRGG